MSHPLVLVTRPEGERDPLVRALRDAGFRVSAVPTVAVRALPPGGPLDRAAANAAAWDWVIVTSRRGVEALADAAARGPNGSELGTWRARFAAVGEGTADALRGTGVRDVVLPVDPRGEAIAAALGSVRGARILLARASAADPALPRRLAGLGAAVESVAAYVTEVAPPEFQAAIGEALAHPDLALGVVASGSAVTGLLTLAERAGPAAAARARHLPLVSIGPVTSGVARRSGLPVAAEATAPDVPGLVAAVTAAMPRPLADVRG